MCVGGWVPAYVHAWAASLYCAGRATHSQFLLFTLCVCLQAATVRLWRSSDPTTTPTERPVPSTSAVLPPAQGVARNRPFLAWAFPGGPAQSATKAHTPHFILFPCATSLFTASFFVSKCSASKSKFSVILEYWLGVQIPAGHRPSDTGRRQSRQGLFDDGNAADTHGPPLTRTIAQTSLVPLAQKSQKPQHRPNRSVRPGFRSGDPG